MNSPHLFALCGASLSLFGACADDGPLIAPADLDGSLLDSAASALTQNSEVTAGFHDYLGNAMVNVDGCTGTLVSDYAVLTAAHCLCPDWGMNADLSLCDATANVTFPNGHGSLVGDVLVHPEYGQVKWQAYDFALVKFSESIRTHPSISGSDAIVPMPVAKGMVEVPSQVLAIGYGRFGDNCSSAANGAWRWDSMSVDRGQDDWYFGGVDADEGVCSGDSGGPALTWDNGYQVSGVLSVYNGNSPSGDRTHDWKPTYMAREWITDNASDPGLPGDTWGHCVLYDGAVGSAWRSLRGNHSSLDSFDNKTSTVWIKRGYEAEVFDYAGFGTSFAKLNGFQGTECNGFGCWHDLAGRAYDNDISSIKCGSALPGDTWGYCVYYQDYGDGGYYSTQGNASSFSGQYAAWNNSISQIWVEKGRTATLYPETNYAGNGRWESRSFSGNASSGAGRWCNSHGCLYDLVGTVAERTASSMKCQ